MKRLSILIADQAPDLCWQLARWLHPHHVTCVQSVHEATTASRLLRFDLIVADVQMKGFSGGLLLDEIKPRQSSARLLVLVPEVASEPTGVFFDRMMERGADAVLSKPFREPQFLLAVRACWHDRPGAGQPLSRRALCGTSEN